MPVASLPFPFLCLLAVKEFENIIPFSRVIPVLHVYTGVNAKCDFCRVGTEMIIRLKWGQTEYRGKLESIDSYMNVLLRDTEEFIDGKNTGSLGLVLIRCVLRGLLPSLDSML